VKPRLRARVGGARAAAPLLLATLAACTSLAPGPALETVTVTRGPFEIVAAGRRIGAGGFPNTSGNPFATIEVTSFSVRHRGAPVTITHGNRVLTSFWRVAHLPDAPRPALLVSTTDFHLVSDAEGALVTRSFGEPSTNMADFQWLDAVDGQPGEPGSFGIEKVGREGMELRGGRFLRLAAHTVLDVTTLEAFPIRPWIPSGSGRPMAGLNGGGIRAIAFSPGRTQYATIGYGQDYARQGAPYEALLVVDVPSGEAYGLPLDRRTTRYVELADATPAWFAHYFRWTRDAGGRERLERRPGVVPLPWTGRLVDFDGGRVEYRLRPVRAEMRAVLGGFLRARFAATEAPNWIDPSRPSDGTFAVPGCEGVVATSHHDDHVGLFVPASPPDRAACMALVRRIAAAFDAELARGAHQDLFVDD
jgi:hypothetical protein